MPHQLRSIKNNLSKKSKKLLEISIEEAVSNWHRALPISDFGFELP